MHSYIFQITQAPLGKEAWVTSEYLSEHPDFLPIADAVSDMEDRDGAIQCFGSWLTRNKLGTMFGDSFVLAPEAAEVYFFGRFTAFQQAVFDLRKVEKGQFLHEHDLLRKLIDNLEQIFTNKHTPYVLLADQVEAVPLDEFMRKAKPGVPYYIGGVLDFHF